MPGESEGPQWPPRSPYEAAMTSPSGRRRLEQRSNRLSPSPSPLKKSSTTPSLRRPMQLGPAFEEEEDDEDEETLQLRLQAIEAKLKLKKLKSKKTEDVGSNPESEEPERRAASRATSVLSSRRDPQRAPGLTKSKSTIDVQVPLSPDKRRTVAQEPRSPGRVLLGIDKGLSGRNVSLRRAPSLRVPEDPFSTNLTNAGATPGTSLSRHSSIGRDYGRQIGKSFNERIAESRDREKREAERKEKIERLRQQRSTGFGVQSDEIETLKKTSAEQHEKSQAERERRMESGYSREEVLRGMNNSVGGHLSRNNSLVSTRSSRTATTSSLSSDPFTRPKSSTSTRTFSYDHPSSRHSPNPTDDSLHSDTPIGDASLFEPYTSSNLSRRILPHSFLKRQLDDKTPILIPKLLSEVKAPSFELPEELECANIVVFASIASKSATLAHKENHRTHTQNAPLQTSVAEADATRANENGKYMAISLTDLKWTIDLYLFGSAYTRWSKLTPGTVIAILNPNIMPPKKDKYDTGRWSLTLNSSEDTILEIGTNKDLGWCKAIKNNGEQCSDWVDKRKTEYCDFHVNVGVEKMRRGRMEVQGMGAGYAPGGKRGGRQGFFGGGSGRGKGRGSNKQEGGLIKEGRQYDWDTKTNYFMAPPSMGHSTANLIDADDGMDREGREARVRKALATSAREREIAKKLGSGGNGAGAEYLRGGDKGGSLGRRDRTVNEESTQSESRDATSLGLKGNKAGNVMLSPLKRKRSVGTGTVKKKVRLVTSKGEREPGRESLPGPMAMDDDDGLDII